MPHPHPPWFRMPCHASSLPYLPLPASVSSAGTFPAINGTTTTWYYPFVQPAPTVRSVVAHVCAVLVESLTPRFALFLVTALMLEQPVLLVAAPGSDELLMHACEKVQTDTVLHAPRELTRQWYYRCRLMALSAAAFRRSRAEADRKYEGVCGGHCGAERIARALLFP